MICFKCVWVADDFLVNRSGPHYSNFPINVDAMADYCQRVHGLDPESVRDRLRFIPPEVLEEWRAEQGGPWEFFADREDGTNPLDSSHVAIDEAHVYLPRGSKGGTQWRKDWEGWLGTIRHRGCTVEFLTQDDSKVATEITAHCERRIVLSSGGHHRFPLLGVRFSDLYQLAAKVTGKYRRLILVDDQQRKGSKWETVASVPRVLSGQYFGLYESYNATEHGDSGSRGEPLEWERFGWVRFAKWFLKRNAFALTWRVIAVVLGVTMFGLMVSGKGAEMYAETLTAGLADSQSGGTQQLQQQQTGSRSQDVESTRPRVLAISRRTISLDDGVVYRVGESVDVYRFISIGPGAVVLVSHSDGLRDLVSVGRMLPALVPEAREVPGPASGVGGNSNSANADGAGQGG